MRWWELQVTVPEEASDALAAVLQEWSEVQGVSLEGKVANGPLHPEYGEWFADELLQAESVDVKAYVPETVAQDALVARTLQSLQQVKDAGLDIGQAMEHIGTRLMDESEWASAWKEDFHPIPVGESFIIVPRWEQDTPLAERRHRIILEPGMAFGTGTHATTQLCLEALEHVLVQGSRVLDIGCGTAVLAIGAARSGAQAVTAIDIDPVAVQVAKQNVKENDVDGVVTVIEGDLLQHVSGAYDIAFANILRDVVIQLAPQARARLRAGGTLITSGFVVSQEEAVRTALTANGFEVTEALVKDDWVSLVAVKSA